MLDEADFESFSSERERNSDRLMDETAEISMAQRFMEIIVRHYFCPLTSSNHNLISTTSKWAHLPTIPYSNCQLCHLRRAQRSSFHSFYNDFPWDQYCIASWHASSCADHIVEIILAWMES